MTDPLKWSCLLKVSFQDRHIRGYLFVLRSEAWPVQLVDGHHDGHHIFTVHDGDGEDVVGLGLG